MIINKKSQGEGVFVTGAVAKKIVDLAVGIDVGSTETRVSVADMYDVNAFKMERPTKDALERLLNTYVIPSSAMVLDKDNREILPVSQALEDNYDSNIIMVSTEADKPMFSSLRVLRGRKSEDTKGVTMRYFDSSTDKMDNQLFYLNILDGIGYAVLQKYGQGGGDIPSDVQINLEISVRPKELNKFCQDKMRENLLGKFIFSWCGREINVRVVNLNFTTEPEAQIMGTTSVFRTKSEIGQLSAEDNKAYERLLSCGTYMHIEGGGSSIGVELVRDGNIVAACSTTFQLGGNYLNQIVADRVGEEMGVRPSIRSVETAVKTGLLRNGRTSFDITQIVSNAKSELAMQIFEDLRHKVIDTQQDLMLRDVEMITLGGRLFLPDEGNNSVAEFFSQYVKQISPETEVILLTGNYIPQGNMIASIMDFADTWEDAPAGNADKGEAGSEV